MRALFIALLAIVPTAWATAQVPDSSPSQKPISIDLVKDYAKLLAKHYSDPKELRATANQLAKRYAGALARVKEEVSGLVAIARERADELGLQERLNLALELWRVRASLDLLSLTNPETVHAITGLTIPDLTRLRKQIQDLKVF
jgi:hypothetical protein